MTEILGWTYAYRKLMVVDTACELDLFTWIEERSRTAEELAERTGAKLLPLRALLDACVGLELLDLEAGRYANRSVARDHLVRGRPLFLGDLFRVFAAEASQWLWLEELVRTGRCVGQGPVEIGDRRFTLAMHALGLLGEAAALAAAVDLSGRRDLIDVGCGSGIYSIELCRQAPELRAALLDRPPVLEVAGEIVAASGLAERITLTPGDMLADGYGQGRDVVLMSDVLYLANDRSRQMLRAAHQALAPGGLLIVRGYFSDPGGNQNPFGALFDLARLFWGEDREPMPLGRVSRWLGEVGFTGARSFPLTERSTCILATK
jgi:SAM-dependent methyltransferase